MLELWFKYLAISKASLRGQNLLVSHFSRVLKSSVATGKMTGNSTWTKKKPQYNKILFSKTYHIFQIKLDFFNQKLYSRKKRFFSNSRSHKPFIFRKVISKLFWTNDYMYKRHICLNMCQSLAEKKHLTKSVNNKKDIYQGYDNMTIIPEQWFHTYKCRISS